jgi:hypothetical protein
MSTALRLTFERTLGTAKEAGTVAMTTHARSPLAVRVPGT